MATKEVKLQDVKAQSDIDAATSGGRLAVLHFWAPWCEPCGAMDAVLLQLAKEHPSVAMLRVEAEAVDEVTMKYSVASVPTFVLLKGSEVVATVEGADPPALTAQLDALDPVTATAATAGRAATNGTASTSSPATAATATATAATATATAAGADVNGRIKYLLSMHPVILFMKGNPETPRCGFSRKVVEALQATQVPFHTFDILTDEAIRQGLKEYANWPTYPQLFLQGELMGGCDIVLEMAASGELKKELNAKVPSTPSIPSTSVPSTSAPVAPPAAASAYAQTAPGSTAAPFSAATTSPAAAGAAHANGSSAPTSSGLSPELHAKVEALVRSHPVMLFMKGSPEAPRCGFSSKVVNALRSEGLEFGSFDILSDEAVRQGLKEYANWPTFPQVFVKGELLGGCDIVLEKAAAKELGTDVQEMLHRMEDVTS